MLHLTITLDASPKLVDALTIFAQAFSGLNPPSSEAVAVKSKKQMPETESGEEKSTAKPQEPESTKGQSVTTQNEKQKETEQTEEKKSTTGHTVKLEDLRAVAATKDRSKVKALLDHWNYKNISAIAETDREAFLTALREA